MTIRLLIAEDHDMVREGLRITFEETDIDVVGEATTGSDAVRLAKHKEANVLLLDIQMPSGDGFYVLQQVKLANPELAVLFYSQHERPDYLDRAHALGASGYLTKRARAEELVDAVRRAGRGEDLWG